MNRGVHGLGHGKPRTRPIIVMLGSGVRIFLEYLGSTLALVILLGFGPGLDQPTAHHFLKKA